MSRRPPHHAPLTLREAQRERPGRQWPSPQRCPYSFIWKSHRPASASSAVPPQLRASHDVGRGRLSPGRLETRRDSPANPPINLLRAGDHPTLTWLTRQRTHALGFALKRLRVRVRETLGPTSLGAMGCGLLGHGPSGAGTQLLPRAGPGHGGFTRRCLASSWHNITMSSTCGGEDAISPETRVRGRRSGQGAMSMQGFTTVGRAVCSGLYKGELSR